MVYWLLWSYYFVQENISYPVYKIQNWHLLVGWYGGCSLAQRIGIATLMNTISKHLCMYMSALFYFSQACRTLFFSDVQNCWKEWTKLVLIFHQSVPSFVWRATFITMEIFLFFVVFQLWSVFWMSEIVPTADDGSRSSFQLDSHPCGLVRGKVASQVIWEGGYHRGDITKN